MSSQIRRISWYLATVITLVYVVTYAAVAIWSPSEIRTGEESYRQVAAYLLETGSFPPIHHRTPAYPLVIAGAYKVFGFGADFAVSVFQGLCALGCVLLTYQLGTRLFNRETGLFAAILLAGDACLLSNSYNMDIPDVPTGFVVALGALATLPCLTPQVRWYQCVVSAMLFSLAALVKPVAMLLPLVTMVVVAFAQLRQAGIRQAMVTAAAYLAVFVIVIGGWHARNYQGSGHFAFAPVRGMYASYIKSYILSEKHDIPFTEMRRIVVSEYDADPRLVGMDDTSIDTHYLKDGLKTVAAEPFLYVYVSVRNAIRMSVNGVCTEIAQVFYGPDGKAAIDQIRQGGKTLYRARTALDQGYYGFGFVVVYTRLYAAIAWGLAFLGIGMFLLRRRIDYGVLMILGVALFLWWAASGAAHLRYRLHFAPLAMVFAGAAASEIWRALGPKLCSLARYWQSEGTRRSLIFLANGLRFHLNNAVLRRRFITKTIHGNRMKLDLHDPGISKVLALYGTREQDQAEMVRMMLRPGMVSLDIGANIGTYALLQARLVGEGGLVYALEPDPDNFALLRENVALNGMGDRIQTYQLAAGETASTGRFYRHSASNLHTLAPTKYQASGSEDVYHQSIDVEVVAVGDFVADKRPVDFVRMDIEGFEVEVLRGLVAWDGFPQFGASILFECHRPKYDDAHHSMREPLTRMLESGYVARVMSSTDENLSKFRELGYKPSEVIRTDEVDRGLYEGVSAEDCVRLVCDLGSVRALMLSRPERDG